MIHSRLFNMIRYRTALRICRAIGHHWVRLRRYETGSGNKHWHCYVCGGCCSTWVAMPAWPLLRWFRSARRLLA